MWPGTRCTRYVLCTITMVTIWAYYWVLSTKQKFKMDGRQGRDRKNTVRARKYILTCRYNHLPPLIGLGDWPRTYVLCSVLCCPRLRTTGTASTYIDYGPPALPLDRARVKNPVDASSREYLSGAMSFLWRCAPVEGPSVETYEFYVCRRLMYIIVLEVRQVDLLALGALQQPFLPLLFLESAFLVPHDNLPCNDGADDDGLCYY